MGNPGGFVGDEFRPTPFIVGFLDMCRRGRVPLDFFSWHCYTDDVDELGRRAGAIRALLDRHGFEATESHLNEWNYLPGNSWNGLSRTSTAEAREKFYVDMSGPAGAAFIVGALLALQEAPVNMANLFHGEIGGFGLFSEHGRPYPAYHGLRAFHKLIRGTSRLAIKNVGLRGMYLAAGIQHTNASATILISNTTTSSVDCNLRIEHLPAVGSASWDLSIIDGGPPSKPTTTRVVAADGLLPLRIDGRRVAMVDVTWTVKRRTAKDEARVP